MLFGVLFGCGNDGYPYPYNEDPCRYQPSACAGGLGGVCRADPECSTGFCCREPKCGGGMCTLACRADLDCPPDMACEHGKCFFACSADVDCAPGQRCAPPEHFVCEW